MIEWVLIGGAALYGWHKVKQHDREEARRAEMTVGRFIPRANGESRVRVETSQPDENMLEEAVYRHELQRLRQCAIWLSRNTTYPGAPTGSSGMYEYFGAYWYSIYRENSSNAYWGGETWWKDSRLLKQYSFDDFKLTSLPSSRAYWGSHPRRRR